MTGLNLSNAFLSRSKRLASECGTPCDTSGLDENAYFGGCADCHAPTVNGLSGGGHDLSKVQGKALEYGVSWIFVIMLSRLT